MTRTIIFLSGMGVPKILARSSFVWDDIRWRDYNRLYVTSKIPTSDNMVKHHLKELTNLINSFSNPVVVGQSLGAWWLANLACEPKCQMTKIAFFIPLVNANHFPIFNVSQIYHPLNRVPNKQNMGPHKALVVGAHDDLIVPTQQHANPLAVHFNASYYRMNGGHLLQKDHTSALSFTKDWIELD